jgi:methanogenic corrinoid protein MtbC1
MTADFSKKRIDELISALLYMDRLAVREILSKSTENEDKLHVIDAIIVPALEEIGRRWEEGTLAISQVYMAGIIIEEAIGGLFPHNDLPGGAKGKIATVVLEDYHMLGERIVSVFLIGAGYSPIRYGRRDVAELLSLIKKDEIKYLFISTLMLPSALKIREISPQVFSEGVKIIVGGAPFRFDPDLGREVGADRVCLTASDAITALRELEGTS